MMIFIFFSPRILFGGSTSYYHPSNGTELQWQTDETGKTIIHYIVDAGGLGRLTHDQAVQLLQAAMALWEGVANVEFILDGTTGEAITIDNYKTYLVVDEHICTDDSTSIDSAGIENEYQLNRISVIGFDNTDREILDDADGLSGSGSTFGRTDITCISGTSEDPDFITSAQIIFDGKSIDGVLSDGATELTVNKYAGIMVHELGHFLGLDHTSANQVLDLDIDSETLDEDTYVPYAPTMEGPLIVHEDQATLNPDDIAAVQALYPLSDSPTSTISGTISNSSNTQFRGAQIELRNIDDPLCEVFSFVSGKQCTPLSFAGGTTPSTIAGNECVSTSTNTGDFFLRAIPPGTYVLSAQEVIDAYKGGVLHPFSTEFPIPELVGDAEFFNSSDVASESATARTTITVTAGEDLTDLNLVLSSSTADGDGTENTIPIDFFSTDNGFGDSLSVSNSRCQPNTVDYAALVGTDDPVANPPTTTTTSSSSSGCSLAIP